MRRAACALGLAALFATVPAHADDRGKSRKTALALAGIGTGISAGLLLAGVLTAPDDSDKTTNTPIFAAGLATTVFTPSLGQMYAGQYLTIGMGVRLLSGVAAAYAAVYMTETHKCVESGAGEMNCTELTQQAVVVLGLAAIGIIGGAAYDINASTDAVDAWNQRHGIYVGIQRSQDPSHVPLIGLGTRW